MPKVGLVYHPDFLLHETGSWPERKERLISIMEFLKQRGYIERMRKLEFQPAPKEKVLSIHEKAYVDRVTQFCAQGGGIWDQNITVLSPESVRVAYLAAGAALRALEAVMDGEVDYSLALVRPPGHHAEKNDAMGFCVFNNVAIAAKEALNSYGLNKVLILDWDVHHGNGTQHAFEDDARVLYFSIHQAPLFPGTGEANEVGLGDGKGYNFNVPLPPGAGDGVYLEIFERFLRPVLLQYYPQLILISAGQDCHFGDPLAGMRVTCAGFQEMTRQVKVLAQMIGARGPVVVLEGGYSLELLPYATGAIVNELGEFGDQVVEPVAPPPAAKDAPIQEALDKVAEIQKIYWPVG